MLKYCPIASIGGENSNFNAAVRSDWRFLITPSDQVKQARALAHVVKNNRYAIDNGAWSAQGVLDKWDDKSFLALIKKYGKSADFICIPDILYAGMESLKFSGEWLKKCRQICPETMLLLPVQDGMIPDEVERVLLSDNNIGVAVGGTTEFKLETLPIWSAIAKKHKRYIHVFRVNTARRVKYCFDNMADSFDGSGVIKFRSQMNIVNRAVTVAERQYAMFNL